MYNDLLQQIRKKIQLGEFSLSNKPARRNILRIGIHSLGSPAWLPENQRFDSNRQMELEKFMYRLRGVVRSAFAVAFVTVPSHLLDQVRTIF